MVEIEAPWVSEVEVEDSWHGELHVNAPAIAEIVCRGLSGHALLSVDCDLGWAVRQREVALGHRFYFLHPVPGYSQCPDRRVTVGLSNLGEEPARIDLKIALLESLNREDHPADVDRLVLQLERTYGVEREFVRAAPIERGAPSLPALDERGHALVSYVTGSHDAFKEARVVRLSIRRIARTIRSEMGEIPPPPKHPPDV